MLSHFRSTTFRTLVVIGVTAVTGASYLVSVSASRETDGQTPEAKISVAIPPAQAQEPAAVPDAPVVGDGPTEAEETFETPATEVPVALASLPAAGARMVRIGLTTNGGPIALWSQGVSFVSDADQPGRRLTIPAGQATSFAEGAERSLSARGVTYRGTIEITVGSKAYGAWRKPVINVSGGPTRITSDGSSPRWGKPYRGSFEIAHQSFTFEAARHKSALRVVNLLPLEDYLKGVVPWEMNPTAPLEALKAQAICARGETLAKIQIGRHREDGFDMCDYDHCQGYPGMENETARSSQAVEQTAGLVLMRDGKIVDAVYGTNSGGITADKNDIWRGGPEPHLRSVRDFDPQRHPATARAVKTRMTESDWTFFCTHNLPSFAQPGEDDIRALAARRRRSTRTAALFQKDDLPEFYRWTREISAADIATAAGAKTPVPFAKVDGINVVDRAASGHIKQLDIVGRAADGSPLRATYVKDSAIRSMFSRRLGSTTALPSSTFVVIPQKANGALTGFVFKGAGWGHGAGLCQRGAQNHALAGWDARRILQWYYNGVEVRPAP